jgi:peptidoglycan/LPS O-acetylase OafA/YrhL
VTSEPATSSGRMDEPWYDWLPIYALLLLFVQAGAIFIRKRVLRWVVVGACFVAIWAMALYVWSIDTEPDEGVNIGAGVMVLWVLATCVVLVAALIAEGVRSAWRSRK